MAGIDNNTLLYLRGDSLDSLCDTSFAVVKSNIEIVDGGFYKALKFNGSTSKFNISDTGNLFKGDYTVEFYAKSNIESKKSIFGIYNSDTKRFFVDYVEGKITIAYSGEEYVVNYAKSLSVGTHFAFSCKDEILSIFIDGKLVHTVKNPFALETYAVLLGRPYNNNNSWTINGEMYGVRMSNIARYTEDFTPPTQPFNSININVTNKTFSQIDFNVIKLGRETINKVEVLQGNVVKETYTDNYDNLTYNIDDSLCSIGNNKITIRVTYDDNYIEEEVLTHTVTVNNLPTTSSLKDVIDRQELLNNSIEVQKNNLKNILVGKNVEVAEEENKLSNLIEKVNELGDAPPPPLYLYNEGDECVDVTGGWTKESYNTTTNFTLSKASSNMTVTVIGTGKSQICTTNAIDLTNYSKLCFDVHPQINSDYAIYRYGIVSAKLNSMESSALSAVFPSQKGNRATLVADISNINNSAYVAIYTQKNGGADVVNAVYNVWLEA